MSEQLPPVSVLFSTQSIAERVEALAESIAARGSFGTEPLMMIGLLRGAVPFMADLSRALFHRSFPVVVDYVAAASYGAGRASSGHVRLGPLPELPLSGRDVLVVDDILDSGLTLEAVVGALHEAGAGRVATCVLLDKPARRRNAFRADFVGFSCPDRFVVGYGMDLDGRYRELPFIGTIGEN